MYHLIRPHRVSCRYLGYVLEAQRLQEVGLGRGRAFLHGGLRLLLALGGRGAPCWLAGVGGGLVEVQGRAQGEGLVARLAHEAVELADAATQVGLAPHLVGEGRGGEGERNVS